jgi:hypothetical protein
MPLWNLGDAPLVQSFAGSYRYRAITPLKNKRSVPNPLVPALGPGTSEPGSREALMNIDKTWIANSVAEALRAFVAFHLPLL